jgi:hypothetical protein
LSRRGSRRFAIGAPVYRSRDAPLAVLPDGDARAPVLEAHGPSSAEAVGVVLVCGADLPKEDEFCIRLPTPEDPRPWLLIATDPPHYAAWNAACGGSTATGRRTRVALGDNLVVSPGPIDATIAMAIL